MALFSGVKAVAFDMDQTLIDFSGSRAAGLQAVLDHIAKAGHRIDERAFLARHKALAAAEDDTYLATGTWTTPGDRFVSLAREFGLPSDGFAHGVAELYVETRYANLKRYPETDRALEAVKGRFPLFLITNGPPASQHREVEVTGLAKWFDGVFVCEDYKLRKPDPRIFEKLRAAAGVAGPEMLIVGDFWEADIETPRKLGWKTAWVVRDDAARAKADRSKADAVVRSVAEVPGLLGL